MPIYEAKGVPDCNPNGVPTMSPHAVNNFVSDLVLMAQAMEQLPQVKAELDMTKAELDAAYKIVQDRELRILDLKAELEAKSTNIRELEVAKDQAETMFLEADDRTARALEFVKTQFSAAGSLIQALEPPKVVEVNPFANEPVVSEVKPIVEDPTQSVASMDKQSGDVPLIAENVGNVAQGQSEPDPTSNVSSGEIMSEQTSVISSAAEAATSAEPEPTPGPYAGKRYRDVPDYVSYSAWVEGGGTYDNYYN